MNRGCPNCVNCIKQNKTLERKKLINDLNIPQVILNAINSMDTTDFDSKIMELPKHNETILLEVWDWVLIEAPYDPDEASSYERGIIYTQNLFQLTKHYVNYPEKVAAFKNISGQIGIVDKKDSRFNGCGIYAKYHRGYFSNSFKIILKNMIG